MLQNAHFLAKIGAATAENERNFAKIGNWKVSVDGHLPERLAPDGAAVVARLAQQVTDTSHLEVRHGFLPIEQTRAGWVGKN